MAIFKLGRPIEPEPHGAEARRGGMIRLVLSTALVESQVPPASPNAVTCRRAELLAALHRLSAVCITEPPPLVALSWRSEGRLCVVLARQPDDGSDTIHAQATGAARIAVPLRQIVGLIGNFDCESLRLEAGAEGPLVIIGEAKLALIMRVAWNFEREVP